MLMRLQSNYAKGTLMLNFQQILFVLLKLETLIFLLFKTILSTQRFGRNIALFLRNSVNLIYINRDVLGQRRIINQILSHQTALKLFRSLLESNISSRIAKGMLERKIISKIDNISFSKFFFL